MNGMPESAAAQRVAARVDAASLDLAPPKGDSPHLARWGIVPRVGDGVLLGRATLGGQAVRVVAQEGDFLGGAVGAMQAERIVAALQEALRLAQTGQVAGVLFFLDSGGVRLHEANPALVGLAQVLKACCALRQAGVPLLCIVDEGGSAFGGAGVLAAAGSALFLAPGAKMGVSGPKVLETLLGRANFDAGTAEALEHTFGGAARVAADLALALPQETEAARKALARALRPCPSLAATLDAMASALAQRLAAAGLAPAPASPQWALAGNAVAGDALGWLWQLEASEVHVLRCPAPGALGPRQALALGLALRSFSRRAAAGATLVVLEDSAGHEVSPLAETLGLAHFLAWLALCHAEVRAAGHREIGLLLGTGVSAAFFVNALQADELYALPQARVRLMDARAMERVTGLRQADIETLLEDDPVLGQPVRHLRAWKALSGQIERLDAQTLRGLAAAMS